MDFLLESLALVGWKNVAMWIIGGLLIFLAIKKDMEPALLLPMGIGAILVNIPLTNVLNDSDGVTKGIIDWMFEKGIRDSEALPILLFIGIGAMIDFGPLLKNPKLFFLGGAAQFGIFMTILIATMIGFEMNDSAAIGIIGAADGPTSILVATALESHFLGAIIVVAYSYMALVPIIQPFVVKLVTTKKERQIKMKYNSQSVSKLTKILFPILVIIVAGLIAPKSLALIGFLMFGNLIRECGVLESLSETAQKQLANLITLLLGIIISAQMTAEQFIKVETLIVMLLGLGAFVFDTIAGVMAAKLMNVFSKEKINPMIGAAGISAFPMSARVIQKMGLKEDKTNHLLMHAIGVNVSGQIASAIVGGLIIALVIL
jgi:oxaloacetate decarboxylase beta subunit